MQISTKGNNALNNICTVHSDEGQDADIETPSLRGGLQTGAASAQGNTERTSAGVVERPAEDAVADSVTVELRVVGPSGFGDIELELPEGYYNDNDGRAVYAANEGVLKSA